MNRNLTKMDLLGICDSLMNDMTWYMIKFNMTWYEQYVRYVLYERPCFNMPDLQYNVTSLSCAIFFMILPMIIMISWKIIWILFDISNLWFDSWFRLWYGPPILVTSDVVDFTICWPISWHLRGRMARAGAARCQDGLGLKVETQACAVSTGPSGPLATVK